MGALEPQWRAEPCAPALAWPSGSDGDPCPPQDTPAPSSRSSAPGPPISSPPPHQGYFGDPWNVFDFLIDHLFAHVSNPPGRWLHLQSPLPDVNWRRPLSRNYPLPSSSWKLLTVLSALFFSPRSRCSIPRNCFSPTDCSSVTLLTGGFLMANPVALLA